MTLHAICMVRSVSADAYHREHIMTAWTVRDRNGELLTDFAAGSRIDVGRKVVPQRYDAFRLHVSSSYREMFERAVSRVLASNGWEIVRIRV